MKSERCTFPTIRLITIALACFALGLVIRVDAAVIGFVNDPARNSSDWAAAVTTFGGAINDQVNFNTHPLGTLQPSFYSSIGVTLNLTPSIAHSVQFGAGPGQANTDAEPLSSGEGPHPPSRFLWLTDTLTRLSISFDSPVYGAGLFVIDLFNPSSQPGARNPISIEAYSGADGTGLLLGRFDAAQFNFQPNYLYFMGVASHDADIGSLVFNHPGLVVDNIGVDDIRFATAPIPEPAVSLFLGLGLLAVFVFRKARHHAR
jgi:hypothetical protein